MEQGNSSLQLLQSTYDELEENREISTYDEVEENKEISTYDEVEENKEISTYDEVEENKEISACNVSEKYDELSSYSALKVTRDLSVYDETEDDRATRGNPLGTVFHSTKTSNLILSSSHEPVVFIQSGNRAMTTNFSAMSKYRFL